VSSTQGRSLPPEAIAMIWVLAEQGLSYRAIARRVECSPQSVHRILTSDREKHSALVTRLRERASRKWKRIADQGATAALKWIKKLNDLGDKENLDLIDMEKLQLMPAAVRSLIQAAEGGEKLHQLLTGGATERKEEARRVSVQVEHKADEIIRRAIEMKVTDRLPAPLRAEAERRMLEGRDPTLARVVVDQPPPP
jgi:hypothetical protein